MPPFLGLGIRVDFVLSNQEWSHAAACALMGTVVEAPSQTYGP